MPTPAEAKSWVDFPVGRAHDPTDSAGGGELGIDLATPLNTPITSPWAGVVTYAGANADTGGIVKVLTNIPGIGQIYEYFLHLNAGTVQAGQQVQAGQVLGFSGGTQPGAGGWPHVEYGLFTGSQYANQYWGFDSGSTLDPTGIINALHTSGGVTAAEASRVSSSQLPSLGSPINLSVNIPSTLDSLLGGLHIGKTSDFLWMLGLIVLGGLLLLAGIIIFILPRPEQVEQAAGTIAGAAARAS